MKILRLTWLCCLMAVPLLSDGLPTIPLQLSEYDSTYLSLSFVPLQGTITYELYRLPLLYPRREVKVRSYAEYVSLPGSTIGYVTDSAPINLDLMPGNSQICFFMTASDAASGTQTSYFSAYAQQFCLQKPQAIFSLSPSPYCAGQAITFQDQSTGLISNYTWQTGDGGSFTDQIFSYTYVTAGTYLIQLDSLGPIGSSIAKQSLVVNPIPTPGITGQHLSCTSTQLATETGKQEYQWYKNGAAVAGAFTNTYQASEAAAYSVSYKDKSCLGTSQEFDFTLYAQPSASFTIASPVKVGQLLAIQNSSTGTNPTYLWTFGDGAQSSSAQPSHIYQYPGTYSVILSVTDTCARVATSSMSLTVEPGAYSLTPTMGTCMGGTVITLTGNAFPASPLVLLAGLPCQVVSTTPDEIKIITSAHAGGPTYYDIQVFDAGGTQTHLMSQAFRYVTLGFAALPDANAVASLDLDLNQPFAWPGNPMAQPYYLPITATNPDALLSDGQYLYIGSTAALQKVDIGTTLVAATTSLDAGDTITALGVADGLHGRYLFTAVNNPGKNPAGFVNIYDASTMAYLAGASFDGGLDGVGYDFATAVGKVYLLVRGPVSDADNKQHKKAMIVNIYDPMQEFQIQDGITTLPLAASKNKGQPTTDAIITATLAFTPDQGRLYYSDPPAKSVYEMSTDTDSYKGPDIGLNAPPLGAFNAPGATASADPVLLILGVDSTVNVYGLPMNGAKPWIATADLKLTGCLGAYDIIPFNGLGIITCSVSGQWILFDTSMYAVNDIIQLRDGDHPAKAVVQNCQGVQ